VRAPARTVRIVPGDVDDEAELRALQRSANRKTLALFLGTAVVLFAVAVGGLELWWHTHPNSPSGDAGGTSVTLAPTTTLDPKPAVEQAYRDYVVMLNRLGAAPDPTDPEIGQRTTGRARVAFEANLAKYKAEGTVIKVGPQDRQTITSNRVDGGTAALVVCFVDQSGAYDATTGAVKQPETITTQSAAVALTLEDGAWKVSLVRLIGDPVEGVSDCAS
jgi:hypothetical protein